MLSTKKTVGIGVGERVNSGASDHGACEAQANVRFAEAVVAVVERNAKDVVVVDGVGYEQELLR